MVTVNNELSKLWSWTDTRGDLVVIEGTKDVPFSIKRIYSLYNIPDGETRGNHAHKEQERFFIPLSGSFEVVLDNGFSKQIVCLDEPSNGLYVAPMVWTELRRFSPNSIVLVLSSHYYEASDYIRKYHEFQNLVQENVFNKKTYDC